MNIIKEKNIYSTDCIKSSLSVQDIFVDRQMKDNYCTTQAMFVT